MKRCLLLILFFPRFASAQQQYVLQNKHATVFLQGAEITGTVKVNLGKGETDIVVTNIAANVLKESITVGADNGVAILSVSPQNNYLSGEALSVRAVQIQDSIDLLYDRNEALKDHKKVNEEQIEILKNNREASGSNQNISVAALQQLLAASGEKMEALLADERATDKQWAVIALKQARLQKQLEEEKQSGHQPAGQLQLKLYTDKPTTAELKINYVSRSAGWSPSYDLRVASTGAPVRLLYKANVYQSTGINWDKIDLTLSTGNASEGAQAPDVSAVSLDFEAAEELKRGRGLNIGGARSARLVYHLDSTSVYMDKNTADYAFLPSSISQYATVNNSGVSASFDISIPYTIPANGQQHLVAVKEYELPATYRYIAAPRYDKDVFLQAQVTGWEQMNLISGQTNIFYEGAYVGEGSLNTQMANDTLNFSLGRDKRIVVTREKSKDYKADKLIGSNVRREYRFEISLRNTRNQPIDLVLKDQVPISSNNDISVEDKDTGGGSINEATGIITWHISLQPNETQKKQFSYFVKYPKARAVTGLE